MAESQPLSAAPEGAEYLRAVLRAPVYEAALVTPLQKWKNSRHVWTTLFSSNVKTDSRYIALSCAALTR